MFFNFIMVICSLVSIKNSKLQGVVVKAKTYKMKGGSRVNGKIKRPIGRETQRSLDFEVYVRAPSTKILLIPFSRFKETFLLLPWDKSGSFLAQRFSFNLEMGRDVYQRQQFKMTTSRKVKVEFSWHFLPKLEQLPLDVRSFYRYSRQGNTFSKHKFTDELLKMLGVGT